MDGADGIAQPIPRIALELRLATQLQDLEDLDRIPSAAEELLGEPAETCIYYDTPDQALWRRGYSLSVRTGLGGFVQRLRSDAGCGTVLRPAKLWTARLPTQAPDPAYLPDAPGLDAVDSGALLPVFCRSMQRRRRLFRPNADALVEAAFEHGTIEVPGRASLAVCEIVLQLKQGSPDALLRLAREMNEARPLRIEARSEAMRGYTLLDEATRGHASYQFGAIELAADMPAETAMAAILRRCIEHLLVNDPAAAAGDVEGVHQMRVALRRLRATLSVFAPYLPQGELAASRAELGRLSAVLGSGRDWDMAMALIAPVADAFGGRQDVVAVQRAAVAARQACYTDIAATLARERYSEVVLDLLCWIESRGWREQKLNEQSAMLLSPVGPLANGLLDRRYRKVRRRVRSFDAFGVDARHDLRIALKKLRYVADSFRTLHKPAASGRYVKRMARLQDRLGHLNDLSTTERLVESLAQSDDGSGELRHGAAITCGWLRRMAQECEQPLRKRVKAFQAAKRFWPSPLRAPAETQQHGDLGHISAPLSDSAPGATSLALVTAAPGGSTDHLVPATAPGETARPSADGGRSPSELDGYPLTCGSRAAPD